MTGMSRTGSSHGVVTATTASAAPRASAPSPMSVSVGDPSRFHHGVPGALRQIMNTTRPWLTTQRVSPAATRTRRPIGPATFASTPPGTSSSTDHAATDAMSTVAAE